MIKYIEYIEVPSQTKVAWDTGVKITSLDDEVYLDFMPLTGSGTDDVWYCYCSDGENNIMLRSNSNRPNSVFGVSFGNQRKYIDQQTNVTFNFNERNQLLLNKTSFENLVSGTSIQINASSLRTIGGNVILGGQDIRSNTPLRCIPSRYYELKITNGNTTKLDLRPCLDANDNPCFYDEVNENYIYHSGSGTPIAGPVLYIFDVTPSILNFNSSGGTSAITVNTETGWTCTTPTGFTLSTTAGTSGETTITVTAPDYTGSTKKNEVITFTDDNGYTNEATLKQKSVGGLYNCFLGNIESTFYLGGIEVSNMYLGEIEVYASGPYIGLKLSPSSISLRFESGLTQTLKVKSSEDWTLALPNDATWLSASTLSGVSGETTVTLSTTEENTGETRTAVITATTASFSATCTVNQNKMFVDNYMLNYNAKEYDATTHSFPKKNGQLFDEDLVLNSNVSSVNTDYVSISGQWMGKTYSSTAENPFNRGGASGTEFTFIYKAKFNNTDDMHNIISNRGNNYNYFIRYPLSWCGGDPIQMTPSQQPATIITTVDSSGNGVRKCVETQQIGTSSNCTFGNHSNAIGFFSGFGTNLSEQFNGDFYWMFLANRKLTDDEIQIVIDYNENL